LKFQAVAEKTAKDARGLLYFDAPGIYIYVWVVLSSILANIVVLIELLCFYLYQ